MPVIGITASEAKSGPQHYVRLGQAYLDMIERQGALGFILPPVARLDLIPELLGGLDGVILSGGGDINPRLYGAERHRSTERVRDRRDAFEITLALAALEREIPILGICRGLQVLNVALGGSLHQDLPERGVTHRDPGREYTQTHPVGIVPGTKLHAIFKSKRARFSTDHHQSIDRLGQGLLVSARSRDGVIEALERPGHNFVLALQSHPEHQRKIADLLVSSLLKSRRPRPLEQVLRRFAVSEA